MPPLNLENSTNAARTTPTPALQMPQSQLTSRAWIVNQSNTSLHGKSISTSAFIIIVAVPCGLAALVFLSCFLGCWKPCWDQRRLRRERNHEIRAMEGDRTLANTDGTASGDSSSETLSRSDTDSSHDITIDEIMTRQVFRNREQKAYRDEIKRRRLAPAQDIMRSSQGLTLPVHFLSLRGKMKALSRSLAGTEVIHNSEISEQSDPTSKACLRRSQSQLGACDIDDTDLPRLVDEQRVPSDPALAGFSEVQENMGQQLAVNTTMSNIESTDTTPAVGALVHTDLEIIPETILNEGQG